MKIPEQQQKNYNRDVWHDVWHAVIVTFSLRNVPDEILIHVSWRLSRDLYPIRINSRSDLISDRRIITENLEILGDFSQSGSTRTVVGLTAVLFVRNRWVQTGPSRTPPGGSVIWSPSASKQELHVSGGSIGGSAEVLESRRGSGPTRLDLWDGSVCVGVCVCDPHLQQVNWCDFTSVPSSCCPALWLAELCLDWHISRATDWWDGWSHTLLSHTHTSLTHTLFRCSTPDPELDQNPIWSKPVVIKTDLNSTKKTRRKISIRFRDSDVHPDGVNLHSRTADVLWIHERSLFVVPSWEPEIWRNKLQLNTAVKTQTHTNTHTALFWFWFWFEVQSGFVLFKKNSK